MKGGSIRSKGRSTSTAASPTQRSASFQIAAHHFAFLCDPTKQDLNLSEILMGMMLCKYLWKLKWNNGDDVVQIPVKIKRKVPPPPFLHTGIFYLNISFCLTMLSLVDISGTSSQFVFVTNTSILESQIKLKMFKWKKESTVYICFSKKKYNPPKYNVKMMSAKIEQMVWCRFSWNIESTTVLKTLYFPSLSSDISLALLSWNIRSQHAIVKSSFVRDRRRKFW